MTDWWEEYRYCVKLNLLGSDSVEEWEVEVGVRGRGRRILSRYCRYAPRYQVPAEGPSQAGVRPHLKLVYEVVEGEGGSDETGSLGRKIDHVVAHAVQKFAAVVLLVSVAL